MTTRAFDLDAILESHPPGDLGLFSSHVNPAFAQMLRTIGYDAGYTRGEGACLYDAEGNRYIDCLGGYGSFALGRNHPGVRDAVRRAMELDLPSLPGVGPFRLAGALARELVEIAPRGLEKVYFCNSGTEGVEAALKFARAATGRDRIVHCARAYHGLTLGALSVNGNREFREGFGALPEHATEVPFNDLQALERALATKDAAAFIVEPIMGKGVHIPSDDYLAGAQEICRRTGTLLIVDEVQTGLGRTGKMFACEHWGVEPDIMIIAKALSGGVIPSAAVLSRSWINDRAFPSMERCCAHQVTFGMSDPAMAAGLATLHYLREENMVQRARDTGELLMRRLRERIGGLEMVKEIRGRGLMIGIEFGPPRSPGLRMGWTMLHRMDQSLFCQAILMPLMMDHRVLAQVAGHRMDIIKLIPPLVLSEQEAEEVAQAFESAVGACHRFPGPVWEVGKKLGAAAKKRFRTEPAGASMSGRAGVNGPSQPSAI